jgi:hypothetical protein
MGERLLTPQGDIQSSQAERQYIFGGLIVNSGLFLEGNATVIETGQIIPIGTRYSDLHYIPDGYEYRPRSIVKIRRFILGGIQSLLDLSEALQHEQPLQESAWLIGFSTNPIQAEIATRHLGFQHMQLDKPFVYEDREGETIAIATTPTELLQQQPYLQMLQRRYLVR